MNDVKVTPIEIKCHQKSHILEVAFDNGETVKLPFEYLRVFSPSAEVMGHSPEQKVLVYAKEDVGIDAIEPVGQYAIKLIFDDGHNTGIYSWKYLYALGEKYEENWQAYLQQLAKLGYQRNARD